MADAGIVGALGPGVFLPVVDKPKRLKLGPLKVRVAEAEAGIVAARGHDGFLPVVDKLKQKYVFNDDSK